MNQQMNVRRSILAAAGASVLAGPFASHAQQPAAPAGAPGKIWRVGYLALQARPANIDAHYLSAFAQGMRELGYVEGRNLVIEYRFADSDVSRLPGLAMELARMKPDVLVTAADPAALAFQKATAVIPIVINTAGDPVGVGLVKSLAQPGGNITGISNLNSELGPKRLQLLLAMTPKASRVAVLFNSNTPSAFKTVDGIQAAAAKLGVKILPIEARTPQEIDHAFAQMRQQNVGALMVVLNALFQQQREQIAGLATKHRLPSMAPDRMYSEAGCLLSYGSSLVDSIRRMAIHVDKIFKGAKPADLPVEQPVKYELVINGKTAKALGLKIPQALLISADRVIE